MKKFWTIFLSALCAACLIGAFAACGGEGDTEYSVSVYSVGGAPLKNVTVNVFDGVNRVASETTNSDGLVTVKLDANNYVVRLADVPNGYELPAPQTTDTEGSPISFSLESHVISDPIPSGYRYSLGDIMYDFTVTTSEGKTFKLSEQLETKKMVLINFWATWCGPCYTEFPFMVEAYKSTYNLSSAGYSNRPYSEDVAIIAFSISDDNSAIETYKMQNEFTNSFDWAFDSNGISTNFGVVSIPVSIVVDRYGAVVRIDEGAITTKAGFTKLFDRYISPNYVQDKIPDPDAPGGDVVIERPLPPDDIKMEASSVIEAAINGFGFNGTYHGEEESNDKEYSWPFLTANDEKNGKYIFASNGGGVQQYSFATIYVKFHAKKGDVFAFDYNISTEQDCDILYILLGGSQTIQLTGIYESWETCYAYVADREGDYEIAFIYYTDEANSEDELAHDYVWLRNFRLTTVSEVTSANAQLDIRYYCVDDPIASNGGTIIGWNDVVDVGLNTEDGYYHLLDENGKPNGPYVLADMMYETKWASASIYQIAQSEQLSDYLKAVLLEYYSYALNSDVYGFVPVTQELYEALVQLTRTIGKDTENEWLAICSYYRHYGIGSEMENPIKAIAPLSAVPLFETGDSTKLEDLNKIEVGKIMVPRGFYYTFTPSETGLYEFRSYGTKDPICWIFEASELSKDVEDRIVLNRDYEEDGPMKVYVNMEKGKLYYVMIDSAFMSDLGTYYVGVKRMTEDVQVLHRITADTYTTSTDDWTSTDNLEIIIQMLAPELGFLYEDPIIYGTDGQYMSDVYVNLFGYTPLTGTTATGADITLANIFYPMTSDGDFNYFLVYDYDEYGNIQLQDGVSEDDDLPATEKYKYIELKYEGEELEYLKGLIDEASSRDKDDLLYGMVRVDAKLMNILDDLAKKLSSMRASGTKHVENEWLMMCYFIETFKA